MRLTMVPITLQQAAALLEHPERADALIKKALERDQRRLATMKEWLAWAEDLTADDMLSLVFSFAAVESNHLEQRLAEGRVLEEYLPREILIEGVYLACQALGEAQANGWTPGCGLTIKEYAWRTEGQTGPAKASGRARRQGSQRGN